MKILKPSASFWLVLVLVLACGSPASVSAAEDDSAQAHFSSVAEAKTMLMVPMRDGVKLATDVYLPKQGKGPFPTIFVRTPYNFNKIEGKHLEFATQVVEHGYALVMQNERGRFYSEGEWEILGRPQTDGYDALTWIAGQDWSNGSVGTFGCSSSAEWQLALAAQNHPAHKAMIPMAAGAGIGRVGEFHEQGNLYKGGVPQTLFAVWLYSVQQGIRPQFPQGLSHEQLVKLRKMYDLAADMPEVDWKKQLRTLPAIDWLSSVGANEGPWDELVSRMPDDPAWYQGGLYHDDQDFGVPAYWFNSWFDVSQGPNLALFQHVRKQATDPKVREGQYMLIAPTKHCDFFEIPKYKDLVVGELNVGKAWFDTKQKVFAFFDHYLKDADNGFARDTPRVEYYMMGANKWNTSDVWPPATVEMVPYYIASQGEANSVFGDGLLVTTLPSGAAEDSFTYDPMNPVPALGGAVCCNSGAALGGSYDQRGIEARADVLVYSTPPLEEPVAITGSVRPILYVSSDARDTDFTVKLVDVYPDGRAFNIDDTIFRARYREGYGKKVLMQAGEVYELQPTPMSTSYLFQPGHRIRIEISSSKFPQYMRNLNTGGNNYDETEGVVAHNTIHHSAEYPTRILLPVVPNTK